MSMMMLMTMLSHAELDTLQVESLQNSMPMQTRTGTDLDTGQLGKYHIGRLAQELVSWMTLVVCICIAAVAPL